MREHDFSTARVAQPVSAISVVPKEQSLTSGPLPSSRAQQKAQIHTAYSSILKDAALLLGNACALYYGNILAHKAFYSARWPGIGATVSRLSVVDLLLSAIVTLMVAAECGLHQRTVLQAGGEEHSTTWNVACISTIISVIATVLLGQPIWAAVTMALYGVMNGTAMAGWRRARRSPISKPAHDVAARRVFIISSGPPGDQVSTLLRRNCSRQYAIYGSMHVSSPADLHQLDAILQQHFVDDVFVALPVAASIIQAITEIARQNRADVKLVPELSGLLSGAPLQFIGDFPVFALQTTTVPGLAMFLKRCLDVVLSTIGIIVLSPAMAIIAIAIKLDSKGPVFYSAHRVGRKGRRFPFHKFRTMVVNADEFKDKLRELNQRAGPTFKISGDPRITRVGKFLRRASLDELPQLWNVVKGDMSIVGPRPHPLDDFERYRPEHMKRLAVLPGITGLWQVKARREASFETNMRLDIEYIENWSLGLDMAILARTLPAVIRGSGE